jgi:CRP-like cAMP-binding protein
VTDSELRERREALDAIHIFAALKDETMKALAEASRPAAAKSGDVIVEEGGAGGKLYVILRGSVQVVKGAGGDREVVLNALGPGDFFGEMGIIDSMKRSASVRALEDVDLCSLERGDLLRVFHEWPKEYAVLVTNIARDLCRRLHKMDEKFAARAF